MRSHETCEYNRYQYDFCTVKANFNDAQRQCQRNGKTLARYLNEDIYRKLQSCRDDGMEYWIGLLENPACLNSSDGPYTWVSNTTTCTRGSPLRVNQIRGSQTVAILLNSNTAALPEAYERHSGERKRYICQYPSSAIIMRTSTSSDMFPATTITNAASNVSDSSGLVAGLVVGGIILIIALVLLYLFCIRNKCYKKLKKCNSDSYTTSSISQNHANNSKEVKDNPLYGRYVISIHCTFAFKFSCEQSED